MLGKAPASAALCAALASAAGAAEHETVIDWIIKDYDEMAASVGDAVVFNYDSNWHNVLIHPTNDCAEDGAVEIGPIGEDAEASITHVFTEAEAGTTVTFACDVGGHCEAGQIVRFAVSDADAGGAPEAPPAAAEPAPAEPAPFTGEEIVIDWTIKQYTDTGVSVGDKVTFNYDAEQHNVLIHPTNDCTEDGAIEIGPLGTDTEATVSHVFSEAEAGTTVTFACDVTQHCEVGQIVSFVVSDGTERQPSVGSEDVPYVPSADEAAEASEDAPAAPEEAPPAPAPEEAPPAPAPEESAGFAARGGAMAAAAVLAAAAM